MTDATKNTRERLSELLSAGLKVREIARVLDLSTQRVYQIKNELETERAAEEASA